MHRAMDSHNLRAQVKPSLTDALKSQLGLDNKQLSLIDKTVVNHGEDFEPFIFEPRLQVTTISKSDAN